MQGRKMQEVKTWLDPRDFLRTVSHEPDESLKGVREKALLRQLSRFGVGKLDVWQCHSWKQESRTESVFGVQGHFKGFGAKVLRDVYSSWERNGIETFSCETLFKTHRDRCSMKPST
jgi:aryl-alcohol dehydrogenase-like predicted oxidoreductase